LPLRDLCEALERLLTQVRKMTEEGQIRLDTEIQKASLETILERAFAHFQAYHTKPVIFRRGDRIYPNDQSLIYYYHNRLLNYGLEKYI
jgi:hypothetical protein